MKIAKIGIDLSMNSTGLVLNYENNGELIQKFFLINPEDKVGKFSGSVQLVTYARDYRNDNYSYMDLATVNSANSLASCIHKLLVKLQSIYKFDMIDARMEGSIMSQGFKKKTAKVNDLTVFNSTTKRMLLSHTLVQSITIVAPTTLKKWATGKGNCKKEKIVEQFLIDFPGFDNKGKIDDISDAYYLSAGLAKDTDKYFKKIV